MSESTLETRVTLLYVTEPAYSEQLTEVANRLITQNTKVLEKYYYPVTQIAKKEMCGEVEDIIQWFIHHTADVHWRKQHRRPIRRFDIIAIGSLPWILMHKDDIDTYKFYTPFKRELPEWENYVICGIPAIGTELLELMP